MADRTSYGKSCKTLRKLKGMRLFDFAEMMGKSPAFICAVETGRKHPPKGYTDNVVKIFDLTNQEDERLRKRELLSQKDYIISAPTKDEAMFLAAFISNRPKLKAEQLAGATRLLEGKPNKEIFNEATE